MAGPIVSHVRNPYPTFPGGVHNFHKHLYPGMGRPHGGFPDSGCLDPFCKLHINVLELQAVILALQHSVAVLQGQHVIIATDNATVVAYINKQGGTHSHPFPSPVAVGSRSVSVATDSSNQAHSELPQCDTRPVTSTKPAHHNRVEAPPRSREFDIQTVGNCSSGHVCHSPQHTSSPVYVSSSGALSAGNRCPVTGLAGEVDVHVSTVLPAQQSHSEAQDHAGGRGDSHSPLVAVTTVVSTFTTSVWIT